MAENFNAGRRKDKMKRIFHIAAAAAIVLLQGCAKEQPNIQNTESSESDFATVPSGAFSIKVRIDSPASSTKTVFDGTTYKVDWKAGDALGIVIDDGTGSRLCKFTTADGSDSFSTDEFTPEEGVSYTYYALYPYDESFTVTDGKSNEVVDIVSGMQKSDADASHIDTPMYGKAQTVGTEAPEITLAHLATVIKVQVLNETGSPLAVSDVTLSAPGKALSGTFSVDFGTGALTAGTEEVAAVVSADNVAVDAGAVGTFFIACAAFSAETAEVSVNDGAYSVAKANLNFEPGKVYPTKVYCAPYLVRGVALPVGTSPVLTQTLENENLYAWRAELPAGDLKISTPEGYVNAVNTAYGQSSAYTADTEGSTWAIPEPGTYRIVLNTETEEITVYDPDTDLKPKYANGTWSNGSLAGYGTKPDQNTVEVECLWMYGPFNSFVDNSGVKQGFDFQYRCLRSLADPNVFVYSGETLPRIDGYGNAGSAKKWMTGGMVFFIGPEKPLDGNDLFPSKDEAQENPRPYNNSYAFGSADANSKRNSVCESIEASLDTQYGLKEGQDDSRYSYFEIPEGCNYVEVNTDKLTVVFGKK